MAIWVGLDLGPDAGGSGFVADDVPIEFLQREGIRNREKKTG